MIQGGTNRLRLALPSDANSANGGGSADEDAGVRFLVWNPGQSTISVAGVDILTDDADDCPFVCPDGFAFGSALRWQPEGRPDVTGFSVVKLTGQAASSMTSEIAISSLAGGTADGYVAVDIIVAPITPVLDGFKIKIVNSGYAPYNGLVLRGPSRGASQLFAGVDGYLGLEGYEDKILTIEPGTHSVQVSPYVGSAGGSTPEKAYLYLVSLYFVQMGPIYPGAPTIVCPGGLAYSDYPLYYYGTQAPSWAAWFMAGPGNPKIFLRRASAQNLFEAVPIPV